MHITQSHYMVLCPRLLYTWVQKPRGRSGSGLLTLIPNDLLEEYVLPVPVTFSTVGLEVLIPRRGGFH